MIHRISLSIYMFIPLLSLTTAFIAPFTCTHVHDGDTITIAKEGLRERIRLYGIDAPEDGQPGAREAKAFLTKLVLGKTVKVDRVTTDRFHRTNAWIFVDGVNVNHELIRNGHAWWFRKYAPDDDKLEELEDEARKAKRGLWAQTNPVPPWEWRK